jgi:hypothetical protein
MDDFKTRTTVSVSKETKARMDKWRATGQCYDGFLCQVINLWEQTHNGKYPGSPQRLNVQNKKP